MWHLRSICRTASGEDRKETDPHPADAGGLESLLLDKSGTDDHIRLFPDQGLFHTAKVSRIVLAVAVHLYGYIISILQRIMISGLHSTADSEVYREIQHRDPVLAAEFEGVVL